MTVLTPATLYNQVLVPRSHQIVLLMTAISLESIPSSPSASSVGSYLESMSTASLERQTSDAELEGIFDAEVEQMIDIQKHSRFYMPDGNVIFRVCPQNLCQNDAI